MLRHDHAAERGGLGRGHAARQAFPATRARISRSAALPVRVARAGARFIALGTSMAQDYFDPDREELDFDVEEADGQPQEGHNAQPPEAQDQAGPSALLQAPAAPANFPLSEQVGLC